MRRTSIHAVFPWVALATLASCHVGGRRGAPMPVLSDSGPVARSDDTAGGTPLRTDRLALVPNLVGLSGDEAAKFAQRQGFEVVPLRAPGSPAGQVLSQDLTPGREAPLGSPIGIRVASGKGVAANVGSPVGRSALPSVPGSGTGWEDATTPPLVTGPPDMTTPRPDVPPAVPPDREFVTPTARGVVVPPVLDRTPEQARRILEDAGLRYREEVAMSGIPGRVMDQDPPAGARRPAGTEIVVKIPLDPAAPPIAALVDPATPAPTSGPVASTSPSKVIVPSVLDKTEAVARRILEDLGLRPRGEPTASGVAGRVMDQLPSPGASVEPGTSIVIRIPGLAIADPVEPVAQGAATLGPESDLGAPDASPSTVAEPPPAAVALTPPVPLPDPAPTEPAAPSPTPIDADVNEPIFASPRRIEPSDPVPDEPIDLGSSVSTARAGSSSGDALPPPMPMPAVPAPETALGAPASDSGSSLPPPPPPRVPSAPPIVTVAPSEPVAPPLPEVAVAPPAPPTPPAPLPPPAPETPSVPAPPPAPILPPPVAVSPLPDLAPQPTEPPPPPIESTPEPDAASALPPPPPVVVPQPPPPADVTPPVVAPVDALALAVPRPRAPLDDTYFKLAPRVVVETSWEAAEAATGYLLEVEELTDGVWVGVERRVVKGTRAIVDLEPTGGKAQDFRWRVRTVVARRGGRPTTWSVFHAR